MVSQQVQQQVQQQAQTFMNQRYEAGKAHTAGAGQHVAPSNPQHGQASKPQPSQASYLQKAAKRANWTPSGSIQVPVALPPLMGGVVLTGTATEGDAPPPYRSAPDLPAGVHPAPPVPAPPGVPAPPPGAPSPSPVKRGVSFAGGT